MFQSNEMLTPAVKLGFKLAKVSVQILINWVKMRHCLLLKNSQCS